MEYKETILSLEPSPYYNDDRTYRIAYVLPQSREWFTLTGLDKWETWYVCKAFSQMGRKPPRIQDLQTGLTCGTEVAILNLFSNRLTDRCGESADADPSV